MSILQNKMYHVNPNYVNRQSFKSPSKRKKIVNKLKINGVIGRQNQQASKNSVRNKGICETRLLFHWTILDYEQLLMQIKDVLGHSKHNFNFSKIIIAHSIRCKMKSDNLYMREKQPTKQEEDKLLLRQYHIGCFCFLAFWCIHFLPIAHPMSSLLTSSLGFLLYHNRQRALRG